MRKEEVSEQPAIGYEEALQLQLDDRWKVGTCSAPFFRNFAFARINHLPRRAQRVLRAMVLEDLSYLPNRAQIADLLLRYGAWPADLASASEEEVIAADEQTLPH